MSQQKKIGFVINDLSGGGAEKVILTLADAMAAMGHDVHIFLVLTTNIDYALDGKYQVHFVNPNNKSSKALLFRKYWLRRFLIQSLRQTVQEVVKQGNGKQFDLLVATLWQSSRMARAAGLTNLYLRLANTLSQEVINTWQNISPRSAARREKRYIKLYKGQKIVAVSEGVRVDLIHHFEGVPQDIKTIYNPMNKQKIVYLASQQDNDLPDDDYIIHVARFAPQKRHDLLLAAYKQLNTPVKLVLLTKMTPELMALIREHQLEDNVICPGFQANPYPWVKKAKLLVLCSDHEGLPSVMLEALACGTPVVSTDCPSGPAEILTGELARWLVPVNDANALATKIDEALHATIEIDDTLFDKFSLDHCVKQYLDLCNKSC